MFSNAKRSHLSFKEYTEKDKAFMDHARIELEQYGKQDNFYPNHVIAITWHKAQKKNNQGRVRIHLFLSFTFVVKWISFEIKIV